MTAYDLVSQSGKNLMCTFPERLTGILSLEPLIILSNDPPQLPSSLSQVPLPLNLMTPASVKVASHSQQRSALLKVISTLVPVVVDSAAYHEDTVDRSQFEGHAGKIDVGTIEPRFGHDIARATVVYQRTGQTVGIE